MTIQQEMRIFRELFLTLWQSKFDQNDVASGPYADLSYKYPPISNRETLEAFLPSERQIVGDFRSQYLWLAPSKHGGRIQPVLYLKYDFSRHLADVKIRLGLFLRHDDNTMAIGFRFESPEGVSLEGIGRHHFYHIQMIRGFRETEDFCNHGCPAWLPSREPTFLLPATDSVLLVLCLISCLYGVSDATDTLRTAIPGDKGGFKHYSESILPKRFEEPQWYWKAVSNSSKKETFIETHLRPEDFRPRFNESGKFPGHSLDPTTRDAYDNAKSKHKKRWPER